MAEKLYLTLSSDEMRSFGYRIVDMIVEHLDALPKKTPTRGDDRATLQGRLGGPPPLQGLGGQEALDLLERDVLRITHVISHLCRVLGIMHPPWRMPSPLVSIFSTGPGLKGLALHR
jgi:hypothetical protein